MYILYRVSDIIDLTNFEEKPVQGMNIICMYLYMLVFEKVLSVVATAVKSWLCHCNRKMHCNLLLLQTNDVFWCFFLLLVTKTDSGLYSSITYAPSKFLAFQQSTSQRVSDDGKHTHFQQNCIWKYVCVYTHCLTLFFCTRCALPPLRSNYHFSAQFRFLLRAAARCTTLFGNQQMYFEIENFFSYFSKSFF